MNALENWFCGSMFWGYLTRRRLLPWLFRGTVLGEHVLELGAGRGAATRELAKRATLVTSIEYDPESVAALRKRTLALNVQVIQGDASALPFPAATFSSAISILMLHHLKTAELQDHAFAEIYRVLRPGGVFLGFEIPDAWLYRFQHFQSTFVPLRPSSASARLRVAGFSRVTVDSGGAGFRICALRARESPAPQTSIAR